MSAETPTVDVLIVTPLEEERDAVLCRLPGVRQLPPVRNESSVYYRADLPVTFSDGGNTRYAIVVTCIGEMGQPDAGAVVAAAVARWHPRAVIIVGIAGGIAANDVALGDLLVASQIVGYELSKIRETGPERRWKPYDVERGLLQRAGSFADRRWHSPVARLRPVPGRPTRYIGQFASGDKIIQDPALLAELLAAWPKLIGVEMEAVGGAAGVRQASPPAALAMIRAVSDLADPDKESPMVKAWRPYACAVAAAFAIAFLRSGPLAAASPVDTHMATDTAAKRIAKSHPAEGVETRAAALRRALEARSAAAEVLAADLMRAVAEAIPVADSLGAAISGSPEQQLRAAITSTRDTVGIFAIAARAIADEDARDAVIALFGGFAGLIEEFPRTLEPDRRAELAIFLAHELFLILIAALLRAGRWALLADLLDRHIFVERPPGNFGPGNVPLTLLAMPGRLLSERGRLHGRPTAPLQVALLHERHGAGGPLAANAPLAGLVDADLLLWLRMGAVRERDPARAEWRWRLLSWWEDWPPLLYRAVEQRSAAGLGLALGMFPPGTDADMPLLRQFLRRHLEGARGSNIPWLLSVLADLGRIGTAA